MVVMTLKISFGSMAWIIGFIFLFLLVVIVSCKSKKSVNRMQFSTDKIEKGVYLKKIYLAKAGNLNYNIIYPSGFDAEKKYPLLLFLHGAGERGDDNEAQLTHGGDLIKKESNINQFIALLPQCPKDEYWIDVVEIEDIEDDSSNFEPDVNAPASYALSMVIELMKSFTKEKYIDQSRVYVAGLSMGGMGTFDLCWRMPEMFAAANMICGAGSPEKAKVFSDLPIRIFHGEEDGIVSVEKSLEMIEALKEIGGNPEVFIYPDVYHDSWFNAFDEPDFMTWMLKYKKH